MYKSKKKLKILGVILAFAFCFPLHFLYDMFPNFLTSIFLPVNESIWEHMKILFGGILLSGIVEKIIVISKKMNINNVCFSNFIAAILSIPIFLFMFLPVYSVIGENIIITIIIMFITIVICEFISYKIMNKNDFKFENKVVFLVILVYIIFGVLTYFPIRNGIFIDPTNQTYGIEKIK